MEGGVAESCRQLDGNPPLERELLYGWNLQSPSASRRAVGLAEYSRHLVPRFDQGLERWHREGRCSHEYELHAEPLGRSASLSASRGPTANRANRGRSARLPCQKCVDGCVSAASSKVPSRCIFLTLRR